MARKYISGSTRAGFHKPNQEEIEAILPWLMRERRGNILFPLGCVLAVLTGAVTLTVFGFINDMQGPLISAIAIGIFLIPSVIICIKNTLTENEKVRLLKDGNVLIAEATVKDKRLKRLARYSYVSCVDASYYEDGRKWVQSFVVSKRISRKVKVGSQGIIIKYNASNNKWLDNKLVFLPM